MASYDALFFRLHTIIFGEMCGIRSGGGGGSCIVQMGLNGLTSVPVKIQNSVQHSDRETWGNFMSCTREQKLISI
jgi:hypothetical protein